MAGEIVMPRLSDTMEEGTILRWLKRDGEQVKRGEELVEIETDKANMTYASDQEGVLETIAAEGDTLAVGEPIARVGASTGAAGQDAAAASPSVAEQEDEPASGPASVRAVGDATKDGDSHEAGSSSQRLEGETLPAGERVKASPLARRIAEESGVDLHAVSGSGPGGRIVKADVQAARAGEDQDTVIVPAAAAVSPTSEPDSSPPPAPTTSPAAEPGSTLASTPAGVATAKGETTTVELTRTQQTIARRMAESKATIPDFTLQMEIDMEECVKLREELKRLSPAEAPTYNDMVVKGCALALREHPRANGSYRDGRVQLHSRVNVGVAVAVDTGDGPAAGALIVPTVFDAEEKSLGEIARETRALAERVRDGSITPPELGGGTFTVSNLGMFGVSAFTAIVNPPQAAILSVGALAPRAVVRGDDVVVRDTMTVTLACDHRILYGADAARFLARVRELLEAPAALTL
ncbi:MAG TPA: dihydrolipoamide acetyltransferase family protein [Solirubrobacteraceae bacterium]|jgi:pyruvate dehydrogenase E2 component (dihydrolipoamide acetyltransferase)